MSSNVSDNASFTLLYGSSSDSPICGLLRLANMTILLDCGWDERFDLDLLKPLINVMDEIDYILLSHSSLRHIGALPYLIGKLGLSCPIYATAPIWQMGQMVLYDLYQSYSKYDNFDTQYFSLDDVDDCFELFKSINTFGKNIILENIHAITNDVVTITPLNAGHSLGGTIWQIQNGDDILIYAVNYNHKTDLHLNGANFDLIQRPTLLISDSFNYLTRHKNRNIREKKLYNLIDQTCLNNNGNILLPVNTTDRVFELIILLEKYMKLKMEKKNLNLPSIVFLSHVAKNTIEFARSSPEWLSDNQIKEISKNNNPFNLKYIKAIHSISQLELLPKPYICLATGSYMQTGYAQDIFKNS